MPKESDMQGEQYRREATCKASNMRENRCMREEMGKVIEVCEGRDVRWKGLEGRGQGTEWLTPHKPLPMSAGKGIPLLLQVGKFAPVF